MTAFAGLTRLRGATPKQEAVLEALRAAGWELVAVPFPGAFTVGHPHNATEIPTPDYAREEYAPRRAWSPFPTYVLHRQLTILYDVQPGGEIAAAEGRPIPVKIRTLFAREATPPWVESREYSIGLGKAIEYINEPHPAATAGAEPKEA